MYYCFEDIFEHFEFLFCNVSCVFLSFCVFKCTQIGAQIGTQIGTQIDVDAKTMKNKRIDSLISIGYQHPLSIVMEPVFKTTIAIEQKDTHCLMNEIV